MTRKRLIQTRILVKVGYGFRFADTVRRGRDIPVKSTSDQPPRKVIVGTVMQPFWGKHPASKTLGATNGDRRSHAGTVREEVWPGIG